MLYLLAIFGIYRLTENDMKASILEHIRSQAVTVARYLGSEDDGRLLIREALKEHPTLVPASLEWFDVIMRGLTKEQIGKWRDQGYNILMDGVPHRTFGDLWTYLDRLDEENDGVLVLEELATWSDDELARVWEQSPRVRPAD